MINLDWRSLYL